MYKFRGMYRNAEELHESIEEMKKTPGSAMVVYIVQGSRSDLGRPTLSPQENKRLFMENISK